MNPTKNRSSLGAGGSLHDESPEQRPAVNVQAEGDQKSGMIVAANVVTDGAIND